MAGQSDCQGKRIRTGHQSDYRRCRRAVGRLDLFVVRTLRRRDLRQYHNVGRGSGCPALDCGCGLPKARRKVIRPEKVNAGLKAAFVFSLPSLPLHADKLNGFKRRILTPSEPVFIDSHQFIIPPLCRRLPDSPCLPCSLRLWVCQYLLGALHLLFPDIMSDNTLLCEDDIVWLCPARYGMN